MRIGLVTNETSKRERERRTVTPHRSRCSSSSAAQWVLLLPLRRVLFFVSFHLRSKRKVDWDKELLFSRIRLHIKKIRARPSAKEVGIRAEHWSRRVKFEGLRYHSTPSELLIPSVLWIAVIPAPGFFFFSASFFPRTMPLVIEQAERKRNKSLALSSVATHCWPVQSYQARRVRIKKFLLPPPSSSANVNRRESSARGGSSDIYIKIVSWVE